MSSDYNKKYKRPKQNTSATTNPGTSTPRNRQIETVKHQPQPLCALLAKDSEWVDILQTSQSDTARSSTNVSDEEEVLQLVECEDGPQMKPLAIMFPGLLDKDPKTLQGMLTKAMSTTEVTRHLVDLGQKANFTFMKKADRLIPPDKQWMESLTENSNSYCSVNSGLLSNCISSDYEADCEIADVEWNENKIKKKRKHVGSTNQSTPEEYSSHDVINGRYLIK
ncbi:uncharacterized protein LOC124645915 [Helicoverpa zea]|uniref:Uncharacterized protein n=2 Tax=Helicoverpa armigera TaxID=29058 RepID=A0A2W1BM00_HELAM|nr:uncharacterized protein LOC124645915 [Helicoverpa zea]XP_049708438.1 uncharacterized protein LOC110379409 isoform X1 [Helicoverpa armigera]PZC74685.1 hypothetical protein B5X24_HaOG207354 [Helicoverpa armigera]